MGEKGWSQTYVNIFGIIWTVMLVIGAVASVYGALQKEDLNSLNQINRTHEKVVDIKKDFSCFRESTDIKFIGIRKEINSLVLESNDQRISQANLNKELLVMSDAISNLNKTMNKLQIFLARLSERMGISQLNVNK